MLKWFNKSVKMSFEKYDARASKFKYKILKLLNESEYSLTITDVTDMRVVYLEHSSDLKILLIRSEMHASNKPFESIIEKIPSVLSNFTGNQ